MQKNIHSKIYFKNASRAGGYAILFVVLLVSIILAMTIGIANIALKEATFTATAKDSHVSFFAADSAGECAVYNLGPHVRAIPDFTNLNSDLPNPLTLNCNGTVVSTNVQNVLGSATYEYDFKGASGFIPVQDGCAYVDISDDTAAQYTTITAHGFNVSCPVLVLGGANDLANARQVERVLTYVIKNN